MQTEIKTPYYTRVAHGHNSSKLAASIEKQCNEEYNKGANLICAVPTGENGRYVVLTFAK